MIQEYLRRVVRKNGFVVAWLQTIHKDAKGRQLGFVGPPDPPKPRNMYGSVSTDAMDNFWEIVKNLRAIVVTVNAISVQH